MTAEFSAKSKLKSSTAAFVLLCLIAAVHPLSTAAKTESGVLIIKTGNPAVLEKIPAAETELLFDNIYRLTVKDIDGAEYLARQLPDIESVERDKKVAIATNATDPFFVLDTGELTKQWYLPKLQVHQAWEKTIGTGITVAVVDTGIDARHEDLNDGRVIKGFVNYCQTYQLGSTECLIRISGELAPGVNSDDNGHGTIVSGIIGAVANNNKGMAGIVWNIRLMPIKALDSKGSGVASDVAVGMKWAADNGAKVINLSLGGPGLEGSDVIQEAVNYAASKGVLIVSAAGNDAAITGGDLNKNPSLPVCADGSQNLIIGVAAVDEFDRKAEFSNYGSNCVDIAAPGAAIFFDRNKVQRKGIVSSYYDPTRPGEHDLYVYASGTSVSAAFVSAAAALTMGVFPDFDVKAVREKILSSVDNIDDVNSAGCEGKTCVGQIGRGRINIYKAVSSSATTSVTSGTLVKDSQGQIYLIERGLKRAVSGFVYQQRFADQPVVLADPGQIDSFPNGFALTPVDGTLVKEPSNPTVYLVEGGQRSPLSYLAFVSRNLRFENVVTLPPEEITAYALGPAAAIQGEVLVKSPDHPAVFVLSANMRRLLSYFVFVERGFDKQPIVFMSLEELAAYPVDPSGRLYPPPDGRLVKSAVSAKVYLAEEGALHGISLTAFQNRGFSFSQIRVLPQSEMDGYEVGEDILN